MTPVEAMALIPTIAAGAIQEAAGGAAAAAGIAAEAAARPEAVLNRLRFLSAAYTVVWVILAAYLVMLSLRQRRLSRQVRRLRERLGL